ncbi:Sodium/hydrogen exchanger [Trametes meyenii]|nr:Sodium/hydrogen exchanger [Trametes meyenii]
MSTALPYEEPSLKSLLILSSFLYILNVVRVFADHLLYGGIVAEIALGIVYGSPIAGILHTDWQTTFTVLGYIGLILVVFEGGLSSNLPMLLSNLPLSTLCALIGIGLPIAFSFALLNVAFSYRPLEAFAAGAALSSTSLGTTLAALNSVTKSRIGTVLISAAIIDDVIGLVIAAVIPALATIDSNSSQSGNSSLAWTIIRPLLSSVLIAIIAPLIARFVLRPLFWFRGVGELWAGAGWGTVTHADAFKLFLMIGTVSVMAAISYYTGTSVLYGAYVAGLILTYIAQPPSPPADLRADVQSHANRAEALSFEASFARTMGPMQNFVLLPLFFASIGFAVPFLDLWDPMIIWRGIVYSILMLLAKLAVGLPILLHGPFINEQIPARVSTSLTCVPAYEDQSSPAVTRPTFSVSTPAAVFMGVAMVARGEIGLLIAQLARGNEASGEPGLLSTEPFLLCIWAILLCTLVGPVSLGYIVKRWGAKVNTGAWA